MTHIYATYKRPTSEQMIYTDWKWRHGKKYSKQTDRKKKSYYIIHNRFQNKGHKKRQRTLHDTQGKNPSKRYNPCNTHAPNTGTPKYIRKILEDFKKGIISNTLIIGDFNTQLSTMDTPSKQRINKDTVALNNTLDQMDLTDIYRSFHPKETKYIFFSNGHGPFQR